MLVKMEDKPVSFVGSRDWIGSVEVALVLDYFCDIPGKIIHAEPGSGLMKIYDTVKEHIDKTGCPIMMGGNLDASSKGVFGACATKSSKFFLILDPHYVKSNSEVVDYDKLVTSGWAQWVNLEEFSRSSFYNLCLPQIRK